VAITPKGIAVPIAALAPVDNPPPDAVASPVEEAALLALEPMNEASVDVEVAAENASPVTEAKRAAYSPVCATKTGFMYIPEKSWPDVKTPAGVDVYTGTPSRVVCIHVTVGLPNVGNIVRHQASPSQVWPLPFGQLVRQR
jgi:hypothetical protein